MEYRWSASFKKKYTNCPFFAYCKITGQQAEEVSDKFYGTAGNVVHDVLEYYYTHLYDIAQDSAFIELETMFNSLWDQHDLDDTKLLKGEYWLSVIYGVKRSFQITDCELELIGNSGFDYICYLDAVNTEKHWILDYKTSTYKKSKLDDYKEQLKFYAYAYYKHYGHVPTTAVMFNKVNKVFEYKFTQEELLEFEKEIKSLDIELKRRFKDNDFPRLPSRDACHWCQYKNVCATDLLREVKDDQPKYEVNYIFEKDKLLIQASMEEIMHSKFEDHINYEVPNAHFVIQAMAKRGIKYDGIKRSYRRKPYGAETKIGFIHYAHRLFESYCKIKKLKYTFNIIDKRDKDILNLQYKMPDKLNFPYPFYEFQNEATDILIKKRYVICQVATGGGKTLIAAECIRRTGARTLFVIDNKDLLMQTKDEYEELLGIPCGIVGMGQTDWSKIIVCSTVQTLAKRIKEKCKNTIANLALFNMVIFDETHIIAADSFAKLSTKLVNTKWRIGFSATPKRDDGHTKLIFAHCGEVQYVKEAPELIKLGILTDVDATFFEYDYKYIPTGDDKSEYEEIVVENEIRNQIALDILDEFPDKSFLILCRRTKHCQYFLEKIPGARLIYGKSKDDVRKDDLEDFRQGKFRVLVANVQIFNKGLNIKRLDGVINCTGNKGEVVTIQSCGRALRKFEGKDKALYFDFVDPGQYCHAHSLSRMNALRTEGYKVTKEKFIKGRINLNGKRL